MDLYQPARLDPAVAIEDTVGAIADLVPAGYVRHIGLKIECTVRFEHGGSRHAFPRYRSLQHDRPCRLFHQ